MAHIRLELAQRVYRDSVRLKDQIHPRSLVIGRPRDEFIEKDEALGYSWVLLQLFADAKYRDRRALSVRSNKLVVFDEAHKYMRVQI